MWHNVVAIVTPKYIIAAQWGLDGPGVWRFKARGFWHRLSGAVYRGGVLIDTFSLPLYLWAGSTSLEDRRRRLAHSRLPKRRRQLVWFMSYLHEETLKPYYHSLCAMRFTFLYLQTGNFFVPFKDREETFLSSDCPSLIYPKNFSADSLMSFSDVPLSNHKKTFPGVLMWLILVFLMFFYVCLPD